MDLNLDGGGGKAAGQTRLVERIGALGCDEGGVTAIEYALMAALIAMAIVGAVGAVGTEVLGLWDFVADAVEAAL